MANQTDPLYNAYKYDSQKKYTLEIDDTIEDLFAEESGDILEPAPLDPATAQPTAPQVQPMQPARPSTLESAPSLDSPSALPGITPPLDSPAESSNYDEMAPVKFSPGFLDAAKPANAKQALAIIDEDMAIYKKLRECLG